MVKVSIIMPVYKAAHFIENSISSFENQDEEEIIDE